MRYATYAIPVLASLALAAPAFAQSLPAGIESQGYAELSYIDTSSDDDIHIVGDFDIFVGPQNLGLGMPLGFDFGLKGSSDFDESNASLYLAATYSMPNVGKFSIGAPRSAYDSVTTSVHSRTFNIAASLLEDTFLASNVSSVSLQNENQSYGLRYDGDFGALRFAASLNQVDAGSSDLDSLAFAVAYTFDQFVLEVAYENASTATYDADSLKLGARAEFGQFTVGGTYGDIESAPIGSYDVLEAFAIYRPTDQIEVTATFMDATSYSDNAYGISGKYLFTSNAYAEIGAIDSFGSDIYQLNLGLDF